MGVHTVDLGVPCQSEFRSASGKVRAVVRLPKEVIDAYGGGFIGLPGPSEPGACSTRCRPGVLRINQEVTSFSQDERAVTLTVGDGARQGVRRSRGRRRDRLTGSSLTVG